MGHTVATNTARLATNAKVIAGMAHTCDRADGPRPEPPTTVSCRVSVTEISVRAALVAGLALGALLLVAWRKPARPRAGSPRGSGPATGFGGSTLDIPPSGRKKTLETMGLGAIAIFGGITAAIVVSISVAWIVTNFLNRL